MSRSPVGVVVLDLGRAEDARWAAASARTDRVPARVLVVENGSPSGAVSDDGHLRLPDNRGFAGGMNAGIRRLSSEGCDRFLLLNNDAVLEPGCLRLLAEALDDPELAAVGPVIVRQADGLVESRGIGVDLRRGRVRLEGQGSLPPREAGVTPAAALSGAALMLSQAALDLVGFLDESYFFSFEDVDWCVRARRAGLRLGVVLAARARHAGSRTIGPGSPDRLYYAARNHVRLVDKLCPLPTLGRWTRLVSVLAFNLAFAVRQADVPRFDAVLGVWRGVWDAKRNRHGPRAGDRR